MGMAHQMEITSYQNQGHHSFSILVLTMKFSIIFVVLSCSISRITMNFACYKGDESGCGAGKSCLFDKPSGTCGTTCETGVTASTDLKLKADIGIPDLPCDTIHALGDLASMEDRLCTSANACPEGYLCEYTATKTTCVEKGTHVAGAMEITNGEPTCYLDPANTPHPINTDTLLLCTKFLILTQSGSPAIQTLMTIKNTYDPTSKATSHKPIVPTGEPPVLDVTKDGKIAYYVTQDGKKVSDGKGGFVTAYTEMTKDTSSEMTKDTSSETTKSVTGSNPTTIEDLVVDGVTKDGKNAYYVTKNGKKISDGKGGFLTAYTEMIGTGTGTGTGSETTKSVTGSNPTTIEDLVIHGVTKDGKNAYYVTKNGKKIPDGKGGFVTAYTKMTSTGTGTGSETT